MDQSDLRKPALAWHETLELHELTAAQTHALTKLKKAYRKITNPELQKIYKHAIVSLESNLRELLQFFPAAPIKQERAVDQNTAFYAGDLLSFSKSAVRNYAAALTETATPALRKVLTKQLLGAIQLHEMIFSFMERNGLYPAYNLPELLAGDEKKAKKAISMDY